MREYEVIVLLQPQLEEEARNQLIARIADMLTFGSEESAKPVIHHWGQRSMAYTIKKFKEAYYVFYEAKGDPAQINRIERDIEYIEAVIRYLVVRKEN